MERSSSMWTGGLALMLASAACGSSSGGGSGGSTGGDPAAAFVGVWVVQSGTATQVCLNAPPPTAFADGGPGFTNANKTTSVTYSMDEFAITFAETAPGELAQVSDASTCRWTWTVSGSTATMTGDNPCTGDDTTGNGDGGYVETIVTNSADSATISGSTMTETLGGTDTITFDGQTVTCHLSGSITLAACQPTGGTCVNNVDCCSDVCNNGTC